MGRFRDRPWTLAIAGVALTAAALLPAAEAPTPTPDVGAGPNHRAGAPYRAKLSPPHAPGTTLIVHGQVRTSAGGDPLAGVVLEAFHADARGEYDMQGWNYRGRVLTDEMGKFEFETIRPQGYGGIAAHIHFVISHPAHRTLRTEMTFAEEHEDSRRDEPHGALAVRTVERTAFGRLYLEARFDIVMKPEG